MGTSAPSKGPGAGVSFDPPWLDDAGDFEPSEDLNAPIETADDGEPSEFPNQSIETADDAGDTEPSESSNQPAETTDDAGKNKKLIDPAIAPTGRFRSARLHLNRYACDRSGRSGFRKAAGHYSKTGMGGARKLANRMRHSTATGARLAHFLSSTSSRTDSAINAWVKDIIDRGLSGRDVIDAIIRQVAPNGGSKDEDSSADSMSRALSEFLEFNPDAELLKLDVNEIREITERFMAHEACKRITADIGLILESEKLSLKESLSLVNEMKDFLRTDLSVQIRSLWKNTENPTHSQLDQLLRTVVQRTFEVYEGGL